MIAPFSLLSRFDEPDFDTTVRRGDDYPIARKIGDEVYVATTMSPFRHPSGVIYVSRGGLCYGVAEGVIILNRMPYPLSPNDKRGLDEILGKGRAT